MRYLQDAWLVLVLALLFGSALAAIHLGLSGRIEQNKIEETYRAIPQLVEGAVAERTEEVPFDDRTAYKAFDEAGEHVGWVVPARQSGYSGPIDLLIGLSPDATRITGLYVLSHIETPGLGDKIATEDIDYPGRFDDKSAAKPLTLTKSTPAPGSNEVQAITGATVSSRAVLDGVNKGVRRFRRSMGFERPPVQPANALQAIFPDAVADDVPTYDPASAKGPMVHRARDAEGRTLGWVAVHHGKGYNKRFPVVVAVGTDPAGERIAGVCVCRHKDGRAKEGLAGGWLRRFEGLDAGEAIRVVKDRPGDRARNEVRAITGATMTSRAVARIAREALTGLRDAIDRPRDLAGPEDREQDHAR